LQPDPIIWHDGEELTADDVKFTYDLFLDYYAPQKFETETVRNINHVEVPDSKTVEIFSDSTSFFVHHWITIPILPKHIWESVENPFYWSNPSPVGSGPYKWKSRTPGSQITLQRNDNFIHNLKYDVENLPAPASTTILTTTHTTTVIGTSTSSTSAYDGTVTGTVTGLETKANTGITDIISLFTSSTILIAVISASFVIGGLTGKGVSRFRVWKSKIQETPDKIQIKTDDG
ncbi:MAG: ABC transporter substrate-binding protein, partial [Candidatus Hodarchaeales archaeon]